MNLIIPERRIKITSIELVSPGPGLTSPECSICKNPIGIARPIGLAWTEDKPIRLCNGCLDYLSDNDND